MAIPTWEEAKALLKEYRGHLIELARYIAWSIAVEGDRTVHMRLVREVLQAMDKLHEDLDERWMGAVFPGRLFEWTGDWLEIEDSSPRTRPGGGGGRNIRIWKLKYGMPPPIPPGDVEKPPRLPKQQVVA
jgi:hypothetical protein